MVTGLPCSSIILSALPWSAVMSRTQPAASQAAFISPIALSGARSREGEREGEGRGGEAKGGEGGGEGRRGEGRREEGKGRQRGGEERKRRGREYRRERGGEREREREREGEKEREREEREGRKNICRAMKLYFSKNDNTKN